MQGEHALPQQFVHVFKDGHFVTTPLTHSAGWSNLKSSETKFLVLFFFFSLFVFWQYDLFWGWGLAFYLFIYWFEVYLYYDSQVVCITSSHISWSLMAGDHALSLLPGPIFIWAQMLCSLYRTSVCPLFPDSPVWTYFMRYVVFAVSVTCVL